MLFLMSEEASYFIGVVKTFTLIISQEDSQSNEKCLYSFVNDAVLAV